MPNIFRAFRSGRSPVRSQRSSPLPLLLTESRQEYKRLRRAFRKEIRPAGRIERSYCDEIVGLEWEIRRLKRHKVAMLNTAFREALEGLLAELIRGPCEFASDLREESQSLAFAWYSDQKVQKRVARLLGEYGLDATAIEAKVLQLQSAPLSEFERLLAAAESQRTKAIRMLAEYRAVLARHVTKKGAPKSGTASSDRAVTDKQLALDHDGSESTR
jgi:hypothetical protein